MKTIREWFDLLPEDIRERALRNTDNERHDWSLGSLAEALLSAFLWRTTIEGHSHWERVHRAAVNGGFSEVESLRAENEALKKRIAELEPKRDWWEQYKPGDKIDVIGLTVSKIDPDTKIIRVEEGADGTPTWLYFDDRHIRPHQ